MDKFKMYTRTQLLNECKLFIDGKNISENLKRFIPDITYNTTSARIFCNNYINSCAAEEAAQVALLLSNKADRNNCLRHNLKSKLYTEEISVNTVIPACSGCDFGKLTSTIEQDAKFVQQKQNAILIRQSELIKYRKKS